MRLSISEKMLVEELKNLNISDEVIVALMVKINDYTKADEFSSYLASHSNLTNMDLINYAKFIWY